MGSLLSGKCLFVRMYTIIHAYKDLSIRKDKTGAKNPAGQPTGARAGMPIAMGGVHPSADPVADRPADSQAVAAAIAGNGLLVLRLLHKLASGFPFAFRHAALRHRNARRTVLRWA